MKANRLSDINVRLYNNENIHSRDGQCTKVFDSQCAKVFKCMIHLVTSRLSDTGPSCLTLEKPFVS